MKERDTVAVAALRSALAEIANAEAVDTTGVVFEANAPAAASEHVAGAAAGFGAAEVERRALTEAETIAVVASDAAEREHAADEYDRAGRSSQAKRLRAEARVLQSVIESA